MMAKWELKSYYRDPMSYHIYKTYNPTKMIFQMFNFTIFVTNIPLQMAEGIMCDHLWLQQKPYSPKSFLSPPLTYHVKVKAKRPNRRILYNIVQYSWYFVLAIFRNQQL